MIRISYLIGHPAVVDAPLIDHMQADNLLRMMLFPGLPSFQLIECMHFCQAKNTLFTMVIQVIEKESRRIFFLVYSYGL